MAPTSSNGGNLYSWVQCYKTWQRWESIITRRRCFRCLLRWWHSSAFCTFLSTSSAVCTGCWSTRRFGSLRARTHCYKINLSSISPQIREQFLRVIPSQITLFCHKWTLSFNDILLWAYSCRWIREYLPRWYTLFPSPCVYFPMFCIDNLTLITPWFQDEWEVFNQKWLKDKRQQPKQIHCIGRTYKVAINNKSCSSYFIWLIAVDFWYHMPQNIVHPCFCGISCPKGNLLLYNLTLFLIQPIIQALRV